VIEFNRAQFRLFTALGQPPICALAGAVLHPVTPRVVPVHPLPVDAPKK